MKNVKCASCDLEFESDRSDDECRAEFDKNFPECKGDMIDSVCTDCYDQINAWLASLSMEEKLAMRQKQRAKLRSLV